MEEFKLENLDKFTDITKRFKTYNKKIKEYNDSLAIDDKGRKRKINGTHINAILFLLQEQSFDELVENNIISRRTKIQLH